MTEAEIRAKCLEAIAAVATVKPNLIACYRDYPYRLREAVNAAYPFVRNGKTEEYLIWRREVGKFYARLEPKKPTAAEVRIAAYEKATGKKFPKGAA